MLEHALIRIFYVNGLAEGVGVLIDPRHVLTSAHVVASTFSFKTNPENSPKLLVLPISHSLA